MNSATAELTLLCGDGKSEFSIALSTPLGCTFLNADKPILLTTEDVYGENVEFTLVERVHCFNYSQFVRVLFSHLALTIDSDNSVTESVSPDLCPL